MPSLSRLRPDPFTLTLVATVGVATVLPCRGRAVPVFNAVTHAAIALLFFLHGARLSRSAILAGLTHWRLHLTVLAATFVLFPLLGLGLRGALEGSLAPGLLQGFLFLCLLPSTVQSSIAFTSMAGGNVVAAICGASLSNLLGVVVTPVLVGLLMHLQGGGIPGRAVGSIFMQLFVPFVAGHLLRPVLGAWVERQRKLLSLVDRGSILLVVYTAFSEAAVNGLWQQLGLKDVVLLGAIASALLAAILGLTTLASRVLGFTREDEITIVFCGSKKSLASGVPMASVLFPASAVGAIVLPLMLFHQIQLMVCAVLARRYAERNARP
ncbi:bile acid:sodium symporter family protein [Stigmatella erecta]|uniref:Solute carrier family 10 (Sodium/bile acid cotransporter), member 7 n=1 Tax=Stigmatella erecta TaxID=83460 RepID=A0A1I0FWZ6_9BACT|nr:bile acid:sodium symporter family protein [Stigmatella erecta]SET63026.1 solute carrier family 10 (sodium/bile acid cotransporter), member 7 [Stigmatella erecta]